MAIEIDYTPRPQFAGFHDRAQRWGVIVAHRRAGKTGSICAVKANAGRLGYASGSLGTEARRRSCFYAA
jgi:hypothetical protein